MNDTIGEKTLTSGLLYAETPQKLRQKKLRNRVKKDCRILYPDGRPGWECGLGWTDEIAKLSYKIECANRIFRREFLVHAEADQVKEKFGGLRFYYTVHRDQPFPIRYLCNLINRFADDILHNADFRTKRVTIKPATVTIKCKELPPPSPNNLVYDGELLESPDGFRCLLNEVRQYEISEQVPTRLRPLWHIANACYKVSSLLLLLYPTDINRQNIGMEALDHIVEKAVREAENGCYSTCEDCGTEIGTDYSPRCETVGWITYVCEQCAVKRDGKYRKGDGIYKNGEFVEAVKKPECRECDEGGRQA